jgi:hypothetical protein
VASSLRIGRLGQVVTVVAAAALLVVGVLVWRAQGEDDSHDVAARTAPYDDPRSAGLLTLCSADGEPVTGGSLDDRPFADVVVGETGLPEGLDPAGAVATLFAYQPREGVGVEEFSGTAITAAGVLADPTRPDARVTEDAWSIGDFVTAFPAAWDGHVQLRLYLGTPEAGTLSAEPYDTADLRVDGDRWELVRGGSASCAGLDD